MVSVLLAGLEVPACCSTSPITRLASFLAVSAVAAVVAGSGTLPRRSFLFPSIMGCLAVAKKNPAQRKIIFETGFAHICIVFES
jgi:hypothetical protein